MLDAICREGAAKAAVRAADAAVEQARIGEHGFRLDQRPYIITSTVQQGTINFRIGQHARTDRQFVNYGKSPAAREGTVDAVSIGNNAVHKMADFFGKLPIDKPGSCASIS